MAALKSALKPSTRLSLLHVTFMSRSKLPLSFSTVASSRHYFHSSSPRFSVSLSRHFLSSSPRSSPAVASASSHQADPSESDFTGMAWEGYLGAIDEAKKNEQEVVETEHLMKFLLKQEDGWAPRIFTKAGVDRACVLQATDEFIAKQPKVSDPSDRIIGQHMSSLLENAIIHKEVMKDAFVSVEHFILAFYLDMRFGQQLYRNLGLSWKDLREAIDVARRSQNEQWGIERERIRASKEKHIDSKWTGTLLEHVLRQRLVGQDMAVRAVADVIQRSGEADLSDTNRPIASFMFIGPLCVGKKQLAWTLTAHLFNKEQAFMEISMHHYKKKHTVSRFVEALTEVGLRRPYRVIVLERIEKAHPDVLSILSRVLDGGKITDRQGRTASFTNTVIIMTSRIGSDLILDTLSNTYYTKEAMYDIMRKQVLDLARQTFRRKFIDDLARKTFRRKFIDDLARKTFIRPLQLMNHIDECIVFNPLDSSDIRNIVELEMSRLKDEFKDKEIELHYTDEAIHVMAGNASHDPNVGAREVWKQINCVYATTTGSGCWDKPVLVHVRADSRGSVGSAAGSRGSIPGHLFIDLGTSCAITEFESDSDSDYNSDSDSESDSDSNSDSDFD